MTTICQNSSENKILNWLCGHSNSVKTYQGKLLLMLGFEAIID